MRNLSGVTFGRLTVLKKSTVVKYAWLCKCACGTLKTVTQKSLTRSSITPTRSCGCLAAELASKRGLPPGEAAINLMYNSYKNGAMKRGLDFELSKSKFKLLVLTNCHYCGTKPNRLVLTEHSAKISTISRNICVTGVDRKDNLIGYTDLNCLPCCKTCNFAKHNMTYDEFITYLNSLVSFRKDI